MTKLVRDRIPEVVEAKGEEEPFRRVVDEFEHDELLDRKFDEELQEWRDGEELEELADLLAVIRDTAERRGTSWHSLLNMESTKRRKYGGFQGGVVWEGVRHDRGYP